MHHGGPPAVQDQRLVGRLLKRAHVNASFPSVNGKQKVLPVIIQKDRIVMVRRAATLVRRCDANGLFASDRNPEYGVCDARRKQDGAVGPPRPTSRGTG